MVIDAALRTLRDRFGHAAFRPGQQAAIAAVLDRRDALVLLPTGAGKSSCYQVPAVVLAERGRGMTVVVSPLIALMNDQVDSLRARGIAAAAIHSQQDDDERRAAIEALSRGELTLIYVSPERAVLDSFQRLLRRAQVAMLAIDEAHCVSQWGHDFRPEYARLAELRDCVDAPVIALTATATPRVMAEVARSLGLRAPEIVRGDFRRPNLAFEVQHHRGDEPRLAATVAALDQAGLRQRSGPGRGIVYCATRKKTEAVAAELKSAGFAAGHYHAGRTALARERAQDAFALGRTRVLVATSAFGMGIDYPDVRVIVHFQAPGSVEAYYQEAGRAGRDGEPGRCVLLFGAADLMTQRRLADRSDARVDEALAALARYASTVECRQRMLCAHFTGSDDHPTCGRCDACVDPQLVADRQEPAARPAAAALGGHAEQVILSLVAASRKVGRLNLARALRGSAAKAVTALGLDRLPQYGALADSDEDAIVATIDAMIHARKLVRRGRKYPTVALPAARAPREPRARQTREPRASSRSAAPQAAFGFLAPSGATGPASVPDPARGRGALRKPRATSNGITFALDSYRKKMARQLKWKTYMVFQRGVIAAIDKLRPTSKEALARIPGLGPAKIARFGDDILDLVRRESARF
ncbi:MAG TPA: ATP-dependent DNA helicase RecQ [Kofleriaceae bacterium]